MVFAYEKPPEPQEVGAVLGVATLTLWTTVASTGHIAKRFVGATALVQQPLALPAPSFATLGALVVAGGALSAAIHLVRPDETTVFKTTPVAAAATALVYYGCYAVTPASIRIAVPPAITAGLVVGAACRAMGGTEGVQEYLKGGGAWALSFVAPAVVTLGLFGESHRHLLRNQRAALAATVLLAMPISFGVTAAAAHYLELPKEATVGLLAGTSTTSLAFVIAETFPDGSKSAAAMGTIFNGVTCMCIFPPLLAITGLAATPAIVRGLALGSAGHISVMVALAAAGEIAAADAAAIVFVVLGTARCILLQIPGVTNLLVPPLPPRTPEGTAPRLT